MVPVRRLLSSLRVTMEGGSSAGNGPDNLLPCCAVGERAARWVYVGAAHVAKARRKPEKGTIKVGGVIEKGALIPLLVVGTGCGSQVHRRSCNFINTQTSVFNALRQ